jgi:hypothetical protein
MMFCTGIRMLNKLNGKTCWSASCAFLARIWGFPRMYRSVNAGRSGKPKLLMITFRYRRVIRLLLAHWILMKGLFFVQFDGAELVHLVKLPVVLLKACPLHP